MTTKKSQRHKRLNSIGNWTLFVLCVSSSLATQEIIQPAHGDRITASKQPNSPIPLDSEFVAQELKKLKLGGFRVKGSQDDEYEETEGKWTSKLSNITLEYQNQSRVGRSGFSVFVLKNVFESHSRADTLNKNQRKEAIGGVNRSRDKKFSNSGQNQKISFTVIFSLFKESHLFGDYITLTGTIIEPLKLYRTDSGPSYLKVKSATISNTQDDSGYIQHLSCQNMRLEVSSLGLEHLTSFSNTPKSILRNFAKYGFRLKIPCPDASITLQTSKSQPDIQYLDQKTTKTINFPQLAVPCFLVTTLSLFTQFLATDWRRVPIYTLGMSALGNIPFIAISLKRGFMVDPDSGYELLNLFILPSILTLFFYFRRQKSRRKVKPLKICLTIQTIFLVLLVYSLLIDAIMQYFVFFFGLVELNFLVEIFESKNRSTALSTSLVIVCQLLVYSYVFYYPLNSARIPIDDFKSGLVFGWEHSILASFVLFAAFVKHVEFSDDWKEGREPILRYSVGAGLSTLGSDDSMHFGGPGFGFLGYHAWKDGGGVEKGSGRSRSQGVEERVYYDSRDFWRGRRTEGLGVAQAKDLLVVEKAELGLDAC